MVPSLLDAVGVRKSFRTPTGHVEVLHGISLSVTPGEMVSVVGPSGSGKSTLLYCLAGLEPVTAGAVRLDGTDIATLSVRRLAALRRERLGFVFQSYNLIPALTAAQNVALPARLGGRRVDQEAVTAALTAVGLEDVNSTLPDQLSGGQQQRVAIARALFTSPDVIFADEPTGALDASSGGAVLRLLRGATQRGAAVLMVTHDLDAAAHADRAIVIRDGVMHRELTAPTAARLFDLTAENA